MMNTYKFRLIALETIYIIFLFFALFASNIINRLLVMIGVLIVTILAKFYLKKSIKKSLYEKQTTILMLIFSGAYIGVFYALGLYFGFAKNKYLLTLNNFINIIIPLAIIIISSEILRNNFLSQDGIVKVGRKKINISIILTFISSTLLDLVIYTGVYDLTILDDFLKAIGFVLFASISCNLLYNYLSNRFGYKPVMFFRLITCLYLYIFPYIPDVYIFMRTLLRMVYPFIIYLIFENTYSKRTKTISRRDRRKDVIGMSALFVIVISIVMLISCQFKYGILVIGSESMTGTINKGDAVILEQYKNQVIKKGQIIVFNYNGIQTVHRVVEVRKINGIYRFTTKGDANKSNDGSYRTEGDIVGLVKYRVKYIGKPTLWLRSIFEK